MAHEVNYKTATDLFLGALRRTEFPQTGIVVFCTGRAPLLYASEMPRIPSPPIGWKVQFDIADQVIKANRINSTVHDGALVCVRDELADEYVAVGWSFRLYPPSNVRAPLTQNRGSAFHSSLHMSLVNGVDGVLQWSSGVLNSHESGATIEFETSGGRRVIL